MTHERAVSYVCGFLFVGDDVALIVKRKPTWQAGRINGIGGKIELGETSAEAMSREFKEEAALETSPQEWRHFCTLSRDNVYSVSFFSCRRETRCGVTSMTDEQVIWCRADNLPNNVIHDLGWLIPLALDPDVPGPTLVQDCAR